MIKSEKIAVLILFILLIISSYFFFFNNNDKKAEDSSENFNLNIFEVSHINDDARTFTVELNEEGYINEDGGTWSYLQINPTYSFGLRFTNVTIPKNAEIIDCYVELYSISGPNMCYPNCKIYFDNVDNSTRFNQTIGVLNISGRVYTENYTLWNSTVEYQKWVKTPSLKKPIQEIVNRKNWTTGNSISVLFVSNGFRGYVCTFQNYENGYPSKIYIKWKQ